MSWVGKSQNRKADWWLPCSRRKDSGVLGWGPESGCNPWTLTGDTQSEVCRKTGPARCGTGLLFTQTAQIHYTPTVRQHSHSLQGYSSDQSREEPLLHQELTSSQGRQPEPRHTRTWPAGLEVCTLRRLTAEGGQVRSGLRVAGGDLSGVVAFEQV